MKLQTIRSQQDADTVAGMLIEQLQVGESVDLNLMKITRMPDGKLEISGMGENEYYGRTEIFYQCEAADLVFWPERKRLNDAIRTHYT